MLRVWARVRQVAEGSRDLIIYDQVDENLEFLMTRRVFSRLFRCFSQKAHLPDSTETSCMARLGGLRSHAIKSLILSVLLQLPSKTHWLLPAENNEKACVIISTQRDHLRFRCSAPSER